MFDHKHYTPILRWKAAEKGALQNLKAEHKARITPLIEFVMSQSDSKDSAKTPEDLLQESVGAFLENLPSIGEQVRKYWGQEPIFISVELIDGSIRATALEKILNQGNVLNIFMIPVINIIPVIGFEADVNTRKVAVDFAKESGHGLCFRITDSHFKEKSLSDDIKTFIEENSLNIKDVDLLVDFMVVDDKLSYQSLVEKINLLPSLEEWRTFIVAGGAFPKDLSHLEKHNQHNISRADWIIWNNLVKSLKRLPAFADYAIQHPVYTPPQSSIANPSASIRYTLEDAWVVVRGEGLRNPKGAGFKQYPAQAQLLAGQAIFKGENFSSGDAYIAEKAKDINTKKTGNPKTWLEAGLNHHLTLVANQIANLP